MVRRKIEIKAIQDKSRQHTTFSKRRNGLFKKLEDFCSKYDAEAAAITFSKAGGVFAFGHPNVDRLVNRYPAYPSSSLASESEDCGVEGGVRAGGEGQPVENRIGEAMESGKWDVAVANLGLRELDELEAEIVKIKSVVTARAREIAALADGGFSGGDSSTGCGG